MVYQEGMPMDQEEGGGMPGVLTPQIYRLVKHFKQKSLRFGSFNPLPQFGA